MKNKKPQPTPAARRPRAAKPFPSPAGVTPRPSRRETNLASPGERVATDREEASRAWRGAEAREIARMGNRDEVAEIVATLDRAAPRPTLEQYTPELAFKICQLLAAGMLGTRICTLPGMPTYAVMHRWRERHADFSEAYDVARATQLERMAEDIVTIADDGTNDTYIDDVGNRKVDNDITQRSRLRIDTRRWLLSKLVRKYGDKVVLGGDPENPLNPPAAVFDAETLAGMSEDEKRGALKMLEKLGGQSS